MKPILFSTPMVQAILEGRKTMTRRIVKGIALDWLHEDLFTPEYVASPENNLCPYGQPGDVLWVRETFRAIEQDFGGPRFEYKATEKINIAEKWKPSIFMPLAAARIFLKIKSVRVQRLQDISEEDAEAEGVKRGIFRYGPNHLKNEFQLELNNHAFYFDGFKFIWLQINGFESWKANPWVWVVEFMRVPKNLSQV